MADPHAIPITLSDTDRGQLQGWARRRKTGRHSPPAGLTPYYKRAECAALSRSHRVQSRSSDRLRSTASGFGAQIG